MKNRQYDETNIFAKIIKGEAKAEIVFENKYVICFNDIFPKAPVHILIIPKGKYLDLEDFSSNSNNEEKIAVFNAFSHIIKKFNIKETGYRLISNAGKHGRQEVPHLHFHLIGGKDIGIMLSL